MSSTQNLGTLSANGGTFYFAAAVTSEGSIPEEPELKTEELRDMFVDGVRYRDESYQFKEFVMETTEDFTSDPAGVALKKRYQKAIGGFATVSQVRNGTRYTYKNVKVLGCLAIIGIGQLIGSAASSGSYGVIRAQWSLRLTERRL